MCTRSGSRSRPGIDLKDTHGRLRQQTTQNQTLDQRLNQDLDQRLDQSHIHVINM